MPTDKILRTVISIINILAYAALIHKKKIIHVCNLWKFWKECMTLATCLEVSEVEDESYESWSNENEKVLNQNIPFWNSLSWQKLFGQVQDKKIKHNWCFNL